jgi:hypothetical protein
MFCGSRLRSADGVPPCRRSPAKRRRQIDRGRHPKQHCRNREKFCSAVKELLRVYLCKPCISPAQVTMFCFQRGRSSAQQLVRRLARGKERCGSAPREAGRPETQRKCARMCHGARGNQAPAIPGMPCSSAAGRDNRRQRTRTEDAERSPGT